MKLALKIAVLLILVSAALQTVRGYIGVSDRIEEIQLGWRSDQEMLVRAIIPAVTRAERLEGIAAARYTLSYLARAQGNREARWVELDPAAEPDRRPAIDLAKIRLSKVEDVQTIIEEDSRGQRYLYTYALIPSDVTGDAVGTIELSRRLPSTETLFESVLEDELEVVFSFVAVATILVLILGVWYIGRPVSKLLEHAEAVGSGDLDARVDLRSRDELGALARSMNSMAARLQEAMARVVEEHQAREQALEQVRHAERLATVGQLAAGVAHEVGTPLSVIRGRAALLEQSVPDKDKRHAQIVIAQVDRITRIVRGMLDFARQAEAERTEVNLCNLVDTCIELARVEAQTKSIVLVRGSCEAPVVAKIDAGQIQQVLLNLLVNAIHASDEGTVKVGCEQATSGEVCIWVEDEGKGMSDEVRARIFEPFFTTKDVGEGTGLGLAVSYGIVQEHQGRIVVRSKPGEGTRFNVFLPVDAPASQPPTAS